MAQRSHSSPALARRMRALRSIALACGLSLSALLARADLVLGLDISPSSLALDLEAGGPFLASVMPAIARRVAAMQPGERLVVFPISSHQVVDVPLLDKRIQLRRNADGDTASAYAQSLPRFVAGRMAQRRQQPPAGQSHLTAAVATARSLVRAGQPCQLVFVTDLVQWDSSGLQYPRDLAKPLPRDPRLDLSGCSFTAYGAGQHLSPRQAQLLLAHWTHWLKAAGAEPVQLLRF